MQGRCHSEPANLPARYDPRTRLSLADLTHQHAAGGCPMLLRCHDLMPSILEACSDCDTQIEDDPI